jgi:hypothetical protein
MGFWLTWPNTKTFKGCTQAELAVIKITSSRFTLPGQHTEKILLLDLSYPASAQRKINSAHKYGVQPCQSYITSPVACSTGSILLACKISHKPPAT